MSRLPTRFVGTILNSLLTGIFTSTNRLATDNQPTSFEENLQFKIAHRMIGVPATTQVAFYFEAGLPVNIMERTINLWSGGREYLVIPDDGSYSTQLAAITTPVQVRTVNGNLLDSGRDVHPASQTTVTVGLLTGTDRFTILDTDQFPNLDAVAVSGTNENKTNSAPSNSLNRSGVAAGQSFFLVFNDINGLDLNGHFFLQWEERP